jgi:GTP-binding protein
MKLGETDSADKFMVFCRGLLHLSVLIETMRREGWNTNWPQVIIKIDGKMWANWRINNDLPESLSGRAVEIRLMRKGWNLHGN